MPGGARNKLLPAAVAVALVATLGACGCGDPTGGLAEGVDKARSARAISSISQAMVTAGRGRSGAGGPAGADLAAELQARDPSNRYTTGAPTEPGSVQVLGGGGGPV